MQQNIQTRQANLVADLSRPVRGPSTAQLATTASLSDKEALQRNPDCSNSNQIGK